MKKLFLLTSLLSLAGISAFALPDYDPFADASLSSGTTYTVGANLAGQTNAQGFGWFQTGSTATNPKIVSGNLSVDGLMPSSGNMVAVTSANGNSARWTLGSATTSGTIYYSMAINITSLGGLTTGGAIIAAFNNTTGAQASNPTVLGSALEVRLSGTGYNIGIVKQSGQTIVWDSGVQTVGSTIFVVGSYTFGGTSSLWIAPDKSSFGGSAPAATLTTGTGTDIASVSSFVIRGATTLEPSFDADEVRVGLNYADVAPVPEPASLALGALGIATLLGLRRFARR
jgi:hypothetical protein